MFGLSINKMEDFVKTTKDKSDRPRTSYRYRRQHIRRAATTAVEFAIVCPMVFLIIFSLFEVSRAVTISDSAKTSVIAGARESLIANTSAANVREEMERILDLFGVTNRDITVTPETIDDTVNEVTIVINVPFATGNGLAFGQLFGDKSYSFASVVERN